MALQPAGRRSCRIGGSRFLDEDFFWVASGLRWGEGEVLVFRSERNALFEDAEPVGAEESARSRGGRLRTPPRALLVQHWLGTIAELPPDAARLCKTSISLLDAGNVPFSVYVWANRATLPVADLHISESRWGFLSKQSHLFFGVCLEVTSRASCLVLVTGLAL